MLFQSGPDGAQLALLTLGVVGDERPLPELQPPLPQGIHLRWAFDRNFGFPWYGFYLFRRLTPTGGVTTCAASQFSGLSPGPRPSPELPIPLGTFRSDQNLVLTDDFPVAGTIEIDLSGRQFVEFEMDPAHPSSRVDVKIGFVEDFPPPGGGPGPGTGSGLGSVTGSNSSCGCGCDHAAIVPIVERVVLVSPGQYRATFGYENVGTSPMSMPSGPDNRFFPDPPDRGQPTVLQPGRRTDAFSVLFDGRLLSWRLAGHTVTVSAADATGGGGTGGGSGGSTDGIVVTALRHDMVVATQVASGRANQVVTLSIPFDEIDKVRITSGPARLIDVCVVLTTSDTGQGWAPVPSLPQPITLPVRAVKYPARSGAENRAESEALALDRITYAFPLPNGELDKSEWQGAGFTDLYEQMLAIVRDGPAAGITDFKENLTADPDPNDPNAVRPVLTQQSTLDLILAGSLHPPIAQMLGLYWVDGATVEGQRYDYLLVGDYFNAGGGNVNTILALVAAQNYTNIHAYKKTGAVKAATPPLAAPRKLVPPSTEGLQAYALPLFSIPPSAPADAAGLVGIRWTISTSTNAKIPPEDSFLFHLWRKSFGRTPPGDQSFDPTTFTRISEFPLAPRDRTASDPPVDPLPGWPAIKIFSLDGPLAEGWYSYLVSGIDLFGRHSARSEPAPWLLVTDGSVENDRAVRVIDTVPPPAPNRVQAWLLDPRDPFLLKDQAYNTWRNAPGNANVVGLRVRWLWGARERLQAPDTREFRVYIHPGSSIASPATDALNWSQRIAIVGAGEQIVPESLLPLKAQNGENVLGQSVDISDGPEVTVLDGPSLDGLRADQVELELVSNSIGFQFPVLAINPATRVITIDRPPGLPSVQAWVLLPSRAYEVFLPGTALATPPAFNPPSEPPPQNPIAYSLVGVSATDDKDRTDLRVAPPLTPRIGNEGPVGGPATVVHMRRTPPEPPPAPFDQEFLSATRAEFLSRSFFMLHAVKQIGSTSYAVRVLRALDETLFQVDFAKRSTNPPTVSNPNTVSPTALGWSAGRRDAAAAEFSSLTSIDAYADLSDNALRLLASLASSASAFVAVTEAPLPSDTSDARGLSDPLDYRPEDHPTYLAFLDTLDGRATNRYFYRTALVDSIQNASDLSVSTPPVVLPPTAVPENPRLLAAVGKDRSIELALLAVSDPSVTTYQIYRAATSQASNDVRLMERHAVITDARPIGLRSQPLPFADATNVVSYQDYFYRVTAFLANGLESPSSEMMTARAFDGSPPPDPVWERAEWVKLDSGGGEHPFTDTGANLFPAIALRLRFDSPLVARALVQVLVADEEPRSVSPWLEPLTGGPADRVTVTTYVRVLSPDEPHVLWARAVTRAAIERFSSPHLVPQP